MSVPPPALAGFDPGPEIRRSVRGHARHAPRLRAAALALERFAFVFDPERRAAALDDRLAPLRDALWRSPHYAATLASRGLSPADLRSLDDLRHFPCLDRETLARSFDAVPALPARGAGRLFVERSTGSTGRAVVVLKEDYDSVHMWALLRFWMRRLRLRFPARPRVALLCTLPHGVEYETPLPAIGGALARLSLARPDAAARLRRFAPHVVFTDPAGLHWLASLDEEPRPKLLLSSAMHLSPALRRRAEGALGAPVLNYYSTAETGPVAWECREADGRFHVLAPDVWVESIDGLLAVTRLRASVLPLLRYRPGDRGEVDHGPCACGFRGPSIVGLTGRRACAFVTPDGRAVDAWQLAWAFQHHPLDAFRLVQRSANAFRLDLAAGDEAAAPVVERLRGSLARLGWDAPRVACRIVPRGSLRAAAKPAPFASFRGEP